MNPAFRAFRGGDRDAVLALCIAAFEPIHRGFADVLGPDLFAQHYSDWRGDYARQISAWPPADPAERVHVGEVHGAGLVAFAASRVDAATAIGEIGLNAVAPGQQGKGIGRAIYRFVLDDLRARGATSVTVGTGGDAAHEPARRAYAAVGFGHAIPALHLHRLL